MSYNWAAHHGLTSAEYQTRFNEYTDEGYRLTDVSGYAVGNEERYAAIWADLSGPAWRAHHGLTSSEYQAQFEEYADEGYRLTHVSGYGVNGEERYAAIWEEEQEDLAWRAHHGLTSSQYQTRFNEYTDEGYRLTHVSGYGVDGEERYAAIWEDLEGPAWRAHHGLTSSAFQSRFDEYTDEGYRLTDVSGYGVDGEERYAAIWADLSGPAWRAHHGLTSSEYQARFNNYVNSGYRLTHVSGYGVDGEERYAAIWEAGSGTQPEGDAVPAIEYAPDRSGEIRNRTVELPGADTTVEMTYEVIDGKAIVEGDIVLGDADEIESSWEAPRPDDRSDGTRTSRQALIARRGGGGTCQQLWPNGVVRFQFSDGINAVDQRTIQNAMDDIENDTNVQFISRTGGSNNFIEFVPSGSPNAGWADVGYAGQRQEVGLPVGTSRGLVIHELLHALGAWHEHTRNDRNRYVNILWNNIIEGKEHNFKIHSSDGLDIGEYDYNSVMHYGSTTFGKRASGGGQRTTIQPTSSGVSLGNNALSDNDVDALRQLYPYERRADGGHRWGSGYYASSIAFGDVDGDGRDEVGITRNATENMRFAILGADPGNYQRLHTGGEGWGNYPATDIAFGDVDGDGRDEVGVTRNADQNNRFWVFDDRSGNFQPLGTPGGNNWGSSYYATSIAFGDVDGDGRDEVGVTRKAGENARFWVFDDAQNNFSVLYKGGEDWGSGYHAADIAFGDVDGDGRDEVGVARAADENARYLIYDDDDTDYTVLHRGGTGWGNYPATSIAFGDVDDDGSDEVGITRNADRNMRFKIKDDFGEQFEELLAGGDGWGSGYYATDIAFGDVDGDGNEEIAVCRYANENARYWIYDGSSEQFDEIACGGYGWGSPYHATGIAIGNSTNRSGVEPTLGVTRKSDRNARYWIHEFDM